MPRNRGPNNTHHGAWLCIALLLLAEYAQGQLSKPVAHDSHWQKQDNKFLSRRAENDKEGDDQQFDDVVGDNICPLDVELKWMTETSSSVYATPLITDLYADGRKDIIVPGFVHYTDVLEGPDGAKALGWPGFHKSTVHASPLLYDIDFDGIRDIVVATYDGEIVFFKDNGELLSQRLQVPRLQVRKNWYVGLNPDPVDHSHPDVGAGQGAANPFEKVAHGKQGVAAASPKASPAVAKASNATATPSQAPVAATPQQQATASPVASPQQQPQAAGAVSAPAVPAATASPVAQPVVQPVVQQPTQQPQPQQQQPPAAGPAMQLSGEMQDAVLKFRNHLKEYASQFGQAAADAQLDALKGNNRVMYDAIQAAVAKEKELQQLVGGATTSGQHLQGANQRRRLMSIDGDSSSQQALHSSTAEALSGVQRRVMQDNSGTAAAADAGNAATAGATPTDAPAVEPDPAHKPLTQEALDSFKIFEDNPATAAVTGSDQPPAPQQAAQQIGMVPEPEEQQEAAAAAQQQATQQQQLDAAQAAAEQDKYSSYNYPYHTGYDEFGDRLDTGLQQAQADAGDGSAGATSGQQKQQMHDLGETDYAGSWRDDLWQDEIYRQAQHSYHQEYVYLDAHILCTPVIADIDGDQHDELVVAVSYFYDKEYYDNPAHQNDLRGIDKDKYVAGGIVVFDLRTRTVKWQQHLDLTTTTTKFTAHMFSSPTLADIDADGFMEIVVGTSVGFVYVFNHKGDTRPGWPIQMGEVQGQVLVADLNHDGNVEIFAGDTLGNIALLDINGKEIWERHVKSMITQGAVAGDVDGDGLLEIVFGTGDGKLHVVRGINGRPAQGFPFQTGGRIQAPATITHLLPKRNQQQHILVMSFDGYLYLIDGKSACAHTVDIGEASYASVLVDDLCGDGLLELLVSTMNGNVYMLQTQQPYHPAKTWTSQVQGINGMVAHWGYFGFVATPEGRQLRDVAGQELQVQIQLWDQRTILENGVPLEKPDLGPYNITIMLKGVGVAEMNAGPQPVIGIADQLVEPGRTLLEVPCPRTRTTAAVHLDVITKHGLHFEDEFVVSFHMHFHKLLKWLIALPLLAMAAVVIIVGQSMGFDAAKSYHLG